MHVCIQCTQFQFLNNLLKIIYACPYNEHAYIMLKCGLLVCLRYSR